MRTRRSTIRALTSALAMTLILAACGGDGETAGGEAASTDPDAAAETDAPAASGNVSIIHYFSDTLGQEAMSQIIEDFEATSEVSVEDNPMEHEAFKDSILVQLSGGNPPDLFSYWAGALTQFVVEQGSVAPIAEIWDAGGFDDLFPQAIADAAVYEGERYLLPFGYHYAGFFYNPQVFADAGVDDVPETWDEFLEVLDQLVDAGVTPIALGSSNRWPAQFWFDYLLLRTAGPEYRASLMAGEASYVDAEVLEAFDLWAELMDAGYFVADANAYDWTDAADQVANGEAAMTLMGTWITGYWDSNDLEAGTDYDLFPFPAIDPAHAGAAVGPIDGFLLPRDAADPAGAGELLTFLASAEVQAGWAEGQGALAPNQQADTSGRNEVIQSALEIVGEADSFSFNYDLATEPEMAQVGLDLFAEFINDPSGRTSYLERVQGDAERIFGAS
jgi:ABC-type glycerol-3-phosphate transport system substrate-binding protein